MKAIKKINNNVAVCIDSNCKELVAFGNGIGFPKMPYEITDLSSISMTFYRIDERFYSLIQEIPQDVLEVSALITQRAEHLLKCNLNPNLVAGLADHINFAIMRMRKFKKMKMLFSYDIQNLYPKETELGRYACNLCKKNLHIILPESEITNIAMHFVNSREEDEPVDSINSEKIIDQVTKEIELYFDITIDRTEFNFNRFAMHLRYLIIRMQNKTQFFDEAGKVLDTIKDGNKDVYDCAKIVSNQIDQILNLTSSEDEILYLMIHIYRILKNTKSE